MRELISKIVAGGLSAAVVLLWWPRFFPSDTATAWLIRGVLWTLAFELLLAALRPVETALWDSAAGKRLRSHATSAGERMGSPRRGHGARAMVAGSALAIPVALLALAPPQPPKPKPNHETAVRQVTEVKRIVRVVRQPVQVASAGPVQAAAPAVSATAHSNQRRRAAAPVTRMPASGTPTGPTTGKSPSSQPPVATGAPAGSTPTTPGAGSNQTASLPGPTVVRRTAA